MQNNRYEKIGIKQVIHLEWTKKTTNLLLAGLDDKSIREELHNFLLDNKSSKITGKQSKNTRSFAVTNLMKTWVNPDAELIPLRDALLVYLRENQSAELAVHWAMISAAYPFWFNVARQTGRLLALQKQVTYRQIAQRIKEQYGDRQTVDRYTQYVVRSFVAWDILKNSANNGCYEKTSAITVEDPYLCSLLVEAALLTKQEGKANLEALVNNPALFPLKLPIITGEQINRFNKRIEVIPHAINEKLLKIKNR